MDRVPVAGALRQRNLCLPFSYTGRVSYSNRRYHQGGGRRPRRVYEDAAGGGGKAEFGL